MSNNGGEVRLMKICITSKGPQKTDLLEERFGRAPYFLIVDDENGEWKSIENPYASGAGGVGPRAAQLLVDNNANILVTGNVGGNALNALNAAGIKIIYVNESLTAEEAFEKVKSGN